MREIDLNLREIDNIVLACTSDNSVRARFFPIKVHIKLDLRSYYAIRASASVRLPKHRFELKGQILAFETDAHGHYVITFAAEVRF